ncbi:L-threonine 3-dehydrogenase [Neomoorella glycerini]|uniref:L-threonine 3-dehydrogenase n=1 Tax=Neomoorella glycerini TaxID=55779 RepID=A0A6I5ZRQ5_9FIRM|nr:Gfo/Idh/MocA family oxidoreductase [Moorella glycerini]QGP92684.1 L-threonine 3-dehydrogenase [Moorella glycerini]
MKQLLQSYRNGALSVMDVPVPRLGTNQVLVATRASVISAGTERAVAEFSEKSLVGKARSRPDLVRQVIKKVQTDGLVAAAQAAFARLDVPLALGYSSAGEVVEVGPGVQGFKVGDRVACAGGGYASHAEVVAVPRNLLVPIPDGVSYEQAAFTTVGAVALQGVRLAELKLGERVVVLGLGLIGLLTVQLVKAAGCLVLGSDPDPERVRLSLELGADLAVVTGQDLIEAVAEFTRGRGADAVLITAATSSNEPTELAGEISRLKGRVVAVGDVGMNIPRRIYYPKELEYKISMSYGPGRYDPNYEEKGIDYPYAYVPFTEQRNMETILQLVKEGKVTPERLITHRFTLAEAERAYRLIKGETAEKYLGVIFTYTGAVELNRTVILREGTAAPGSRGAGEVRLGMLGAGNFARLMLLPRLKKMPGVNLIGLATATGLSGRYTGEKYGFGYCTTDTEKVLSDTEINAVVIATRHNTHAGLAVRALRAGKHVFVEKPLATTEEELDMVLKAAGESSGTLMVGFNRRFAPLGRLAREVFGSHSQPLCMLYRVNAGYIPPEHWTQAQEEGGGRVIGEVCHFVDFLQFVCGSPPVAVSACGVKSGSLSPEDHLTVSLRFADGSIGTVLYFANGDKAVPKEYVEIYGGGKTLIIDDFRGGRLAQGGRVRKVGSRRQDKGHTQELISWLKVVKEGGSSPVPLAESAATTMATFAIIESLRQGGAVVPVTRILGAKATEQNGDMANVTADRSTLHYGEDVQTGP